MKQKRIMHYGSFDKILLVGEGDFSFALCLARAFSSGTNMVATCLDSRASLRHKYADATRNLSELESLGCTIVDKVDIHEMSKHPSLQSKVFDIIIFNFPHAGSINREDDCSQIERHKGLIRGFLWNARHMLDEGGEIHITHKTTYPYSEWKIKKLAKNQKLVLLCEKEFFLSCYPGYKNKRGHGKKQRDKSFPVGECSTFIFAKRS